MQGLVMMLGEPYHDQVTAIWRQLEATLDVQVLEFPHFSFHLTPLYNRPVLDKIVDSVVTQWEPFTVTSTGLGIFFGPEEHVIYATVTRSPELSRLHAYLWEQLYPITDIDVPMVPYYHPDSWVPHITLAHAPHHAVPSILEQLYAITFPWQITVDNLSVIGNEVPNDGLILQRGFGRK